VDVSDDSESFGDSSKSCSVISGEVKYQYRALADP
jgi:hypothetical protein